MGDGPFVGRGRVPRAVFKSARFPQNAGGGTTRRADRGGPLETTALEYKRALASREQIIQHGPASGWDRQSTHTKGIPVNKGLFVAAALMFGLIGCKSVGEHGMAKITHHDHAIAVYVNADARVIEVSVHELRVKGTDQVIFWNLRNQGGQRYAFPEDGIFFKTEAGRAQFRCNKQNDTRFMCLDKGDVKGRFEYGETEWFAHRTDARSVRRQQLADSQPRGRFRCGRATILRCKDGACR